MGPEGETRAAHRVPWPVTRLPAKRIVNERLATSDDNERIYAPKKNIIGRAPDAASSPRRESREPRACFRARHPAAGNRDPHTRLLSPPPPGPPHPPSVPDPRPRRVFPQKNAPRQAPSHRRLPCALPDPAQAAPHPNAQSPTPGRHPSSAICQDRPRDPACLPALETRRSLPKRRPRAHTKQKTKKEDAQGWGEGGTHAPLGQIDAQPRRLHDVHGTVLSHLSFSLRSHWRVRRRQHQRQDLTKMRHGERK